MKTSKPANGANIVDDARVGADGVRPQTFQAYFMRPYEHHLQPNYFQQRGAKTDLLGQKIGQNLKQVFK